MSETSACTAYRTHHNQPLRPHLREEIAPAARRVRRGAHATTSVYGNAPPKIESAPMARSTFPPPSDHELQVGERARAARVRDRIGSARPSRDEPHPDAALLPLDVTAWTRNSAQTSSLARARGGTRGDRSREQSQGGSLVVARFASARTCRHASKPELGELLPSVRHDEGLPGSRRLQLRSRTSRSLPTAPTSASRASSRHETRTTPRSRMRPCIQIARGVLQRCRRLPASRPGTRSAAFAAASLAPA